MKDEYLLKKWLLDELTASELEDFKKSEYYDLNVKMLEKVKHFDVPNDASVKSYDEFRNDSKQKKVPVIQFTSYKFLFRVASILVMGVGIYFLFFFNDLTTVETLANQNTTFELPDASSVVLNDASKATYNKKEWAKKRAVSLQGEAFFEVAKGSKFDVITSSGTISVLGTQFSVKNRTHYFEVACFEGIVSVTNNGKVQRLTKGRVYRFINNIVTLDSIQNKLPTWMRNVSSFKGVPLYNVLKELERQYNVTINTGNIDTTRLFSGGFVNDDLEQALASITIPFNLTFKKDNSNKITLFKTQQ